MQIDGIKGHRLTDIESRIFQMCEEDRALQKVIDGLNEIGCTSFMLTKEEIEQIFKDGLEFFGCNVLTKDDEDDIILNRLKKMGLVK
jgi:hypothetical protein